MDRASGEAVVPGALAVATAEEVVRLLLEIRVLCR